MSHSLGSYAERRADAAGRYESRRDGGLSARIGAGAAMRGEAAQMLAAVAAAETVGFGGPDIAARVSGIAASLRRQHGSASGTVACLALTRQLVATHLGFRAHDEQIAGAWHMLQGRLIEMDTGEGKTVTAVFAAAAHALAGRTVHLITVNDYLAERDAREMGPVYRGLGLSVGCIVQGMDDAARRAAYRSAIVYVTPKQLMFDYLRDRIRLGARAASPLRTELAVLRGGRGAGYFLGGLVVGLVDEADSVLIDEAVVPLIISRQEAAPDQGRVAADAVDLARQLLRGEDFGIAPHGRDLWLTDAGRLHLEHLARVIGGVFAAKVWREQYGEQALTALHLFRRDRDYIIREGAIEIVDINTGRTMPDRSWERGLHQMIQAKEGLPITAPNESLARISHQAFFQRYLNLCGMSGTLREVAGEIRSVYGLRSVRIPPHRPSRRIRAGVAVLRTADAKDRRVAAHAAACAAEGRAVLIGTRTVGDSERLSARLAADGVAHTVLNARFDAEEAAIVAAAGAAGAVTVATNMAGRGTDIRIGSAVARNGGLHVIATERHESRRIDRQLFGRTARQGDPGSYEEILSLDDELVTRHLPRVLRLLARLPLGLGLGAIRLGQIRASRQGKRLRADLARYERGMEQALSFAGRRSAADGE